LFKIKICYLSTYSQYSRRSSKSLARQMSQGMLDTAETLARETIRCSRAMDQMRIERRVTTGFCGPRVPARMGRVLFRAGRKRWDFVISCREIESDRGVDRRWNMRRREKESAGYIRLSLRRSNKIRWHDRGRREREKERERERRVHFSRACKKKAERGYVNVATRRRDEMRSLVECEPEKFLGRRRHTQFIRGRCLRHNFALAISREQCW